MNNRNIFVNISGKKGFNAERKNSVYLPIHGSTNEGQFLFEFLTGPDQK
jgi:hypothetical protein